MRAFDRGRVRHKAVCIWFFLIWLTGILVAAPASADAPEIYVLKVKGTIIPVVADYIDRGLSQAEAHGAATIIIELDTPGGLGSSMQEIMQRILNAKVPVVVYVAPAGAWAASAGVFITMSAHIAAMAPGTSIGAAHPIVMGQSGEVAELPEDIEQKLVNAAVAQIKSAAAQQNRNVDWAEKAVRESATATEQEALELNVIDLVAPDLGSLITQLEGQEVILASGKTVILHTKGALIKETEMNSVERFLFAISDPNIAYILLSLAMLGLLVELSNPGAILPGVVGGVSLFLALYSLGMLEAHYAGIFLIVLAFGLFLADAFVTSHGLLTVGGIASLVTGSMILFSGSPVFEVDKRLIAGVVVVITAIFAFVLNAIVATHRRKQPTGREGMIGITAVARTSLDPKGTVFVHGELWEAIMDEGRVEPGEEVRITKVEGLKLWVTKNK